MKLNQYSDKSFCICGDNTKEYKEELKSLGGKWNSNLKDGPGWIFSNKNKEKVQEWLDKISICEHVYEEEKVHSECSTEVDRPEVHTQLPSEKDKKNLILKDYSEKSFVISGETKNFKEELKSIGGKWNSNLKDGPGWIFSNKRKEKVQKWLIDEPISSESSDISEGEVSHDITINEYSDKSFVLTGATKKYKEDIKKLGGKWNSNLKDGPGWIFSNKQKEPVTKWLSTI